MLDGFSSALPKGLTGLLGISLRLKGVRDNNQGLRSGKSNHEHDNFDDCNGDLGGLRPPGVLPFQKSAPNRKGDGSYWDLDHTSRTGFRVRDHYDRVCRGDVFNRLHS